MAVFAVSKFAVGVNFSFKSSQGEVLLTSTRYQSMAACKAGIESFRNIMSATIEDHTLPRTEPCRLPRYEIDANIAGEYYFCIIDTNGQEVARSRVFVKKVECVKAIEYLRRNADNAKISIRK